MSDTGGADLYLLHLPTRRVSRLTDSLEQELYPRFLPDGKRIAFSSGLPNFDANGYLFERHIYAYDAASGKTAQVTTDKKRYDCATAFSADGRFIVFDGATPKTRNSYLSDIYVMETATNVCRRLTNEGYNGARARVSGVTTRRFFSRRTRTRKTRKGCTSLPSP